MKRLIVAAIVALVGCAGDTNGDNNNAGCMDPNPADCVIVCDVAESTTWSACAEYTLRGKIYVTGNSTLTIPAGTTVYGDTGGADSAALIVTRGSQISAVGTAASPIVFTSNAPTRATGDWAGLALLGSATINNGSCINDGDQTTEQCDAPGYLQGQIEGIDPSDPRGQYGGSNDASSCGTLNYVRVEFAGAEFSMDNELNGLTLGACGSATDVSYVQVHRGKDDGIEFFGGTAGMDHVVISGASDDSMDWDEGWRGQVQFLVIHQFPGLGDAGFEADSLGADEDAMPRSNPTLFNVAMIGTADTRGMVLREGTLGTLRNFIITGFGSEAVDLRAAQVDLTSDWPTNLSIENSVFWDNGDYAEETGEEDDDMGFVEQTAIEAAERNNTLDEDPGLTISDTAPNYVPTNDAMGGQATPTFGDTSANYAGAFEPNASTAWTADWTAYP